MLKEKIIGIRDTAKGLYWDVQGEFLHQMNLFTFQSMKIMLKKELVKMKQINIIKWTDMWLACTFSVIFINFRFRRMTSPR